MGGSSVPLRMWRNTRETPAKWVWRKPPNIWIPSSRPAKPWAEEKISLYSCTTVHCIKHIILLKVVDPFLHFTGCNEIWNPIKCQYWKRCASRVNTEPLCSVCLKKLCSSWTVIFRFIVMPMTTAYHMHRSIDQIEIFWKSETIMKGMEQE